MPLGYFGSKRRLGATYPRPTYDTIVEPFAGAAGYSLTGDNWTRDVMLIDNNPEVICAWRWIQQATDTELLALPYMEHGVEFIQDDPVGTIMRWTNGLSGYIDKGRWPTKPQVRDWNGWNRARVQREAHKIRHWQIIEGDYRDAPDTKATWFIDPPYQHFGGAYGSDRIDYQLLGDWCVDRWGQVIVCEQEPAAWLPFEHHTSNQTTTNAYVSELIWTNTPALRLF